MKRFSRKTAVMTAGAAFMLAAGIFLLLSQEAPGPSASSGPVRIAQAPAAGAGPPAGTAKAKRKRLAELEREEARVSAEHTMLFWEVDRAERAMCGASAEFRRAWEIWDLLRGWEYMHKPEGGDAFRAAPEFVKVKRFLWLEEYRALLSHPQSGGMVRTFMESERQRYAAGDVQTRERMNVQMRQD